MPRSMTMLALALVPAVTLGLTPAGAAEFPVRIDQVDDLKAVFATVESVDRTVARARIGGTLTALGIDEGSRVEAGETLAVVEDPKLPLRLSALDAQVVSLEAQSELAGLEHKRIADLRRSGAVSQARLDQARTDFDVVKGRLAAMRAERAVVARQLAEGAVLAPAAGRVLRVHATAGMVMLPGEPVADIATETYVLRLYLPERHARFLSEGDQVQVGARGLAIEQAPLRPGVVRQVYPELAAGRVVADVAVEGIGDFFVGERTRVYVATGTRPAIRIPEDFLIRRYGLAYVRLKAGGEVVVQVGPAAAGEVEVLAGLEPGDVLLAP